MDRQDVARQNQVEQDMLRHITEGLRASAGWQVPGPDASRKLSTLRFVAQSFQRHLTGSDNNLTRKVPGGDLIQIAAVKGLVAGSVNLGRRLACDRRYRGASEPATFAVLDGGVGGNPENQWPVAWTVPPDAQGDGSVTVVLRTP